MLSVLSDLRTLRYALEDDVFLVLGGSDGHRINRRPKDMAVISLWGVLLIPHRNFCFH